VSKVTSFLDDAWQVSLYDCVSGSRLFWGPVGWELRQ